MRFAEPWWLGGTGLALVVAAFLIAGGLLLLRAHRRFGDPERVTALVTDRAGGRRAFKGVLLVLAVSAGFLALARPQYGRGTRLVPATNLDVVIVLDYSKSMFARDVAPSRIQRAKAEVGRLVTELPGARFGAVAFAGEPVAFPLTSDSASISQFFRQLSPNDMPVGGTAIARALEAGRRLFDRDPLSKRHAKALLLITDGEDLQGDPVAVAKGAAADGVTVHVVQIGGRTPEPIPDVDENGEVRGFRRDSTGRPLTTSLSADGEKQLADIAEASGGNVVRSEQGDTGIVAVTRSMKKRMTEELSERVETVYADVYAYPAGLAVLLLLLEAFVPESRRRRNPRAQAVVAASAAIALPSLFGCEGGVRDPFIRRAPVVQEAIAAYDAGDAGAAMQKLEDYLSTGPCKQGSIGTPDSVRARPNASFDLGLALYAVAERFGGTLRRADAPLGGGPPPKSDADEIDCAVKIVGVVRGDAANPIALRSRASYLAGNLELLRGQYRAAVAAYDESLKLMPARENAGDPVARNAAHNRAIALRLAEEEEREPPDAGPKEPPEEPDAGGEQGDSGSKKNPSDGGRPEEADDAPDGGASSKRDPEKDDGQPEEKDQAKQEKPGEPEPSEEEAAREQPPETERASQSPDERMLDELEQVPTVQQEAVRRQGARRVVGMEDK
jgi:Ca-activated chloride channel family protein